MSEPILMTVVQFHDYSIKAMKELGLEMTLENYEKALIAGEKSAKENGIRIVMG